MIYLETKVVARPRPQVVDHGARDRLEPEGRQRFREDAGQFNSGDRVTCPEQSEQVVDACLAPRETTSGS